MYVQKLAEGRGGVGRGGAVHIRKVILYTLWRVVPGVIVFIYCYLMNILSIHT